MPGQLIPFFQSFHIYIFDVCCWRADPSYSAQRFQYGSKLLPCSITYYIYILYDIDGILLCTAAAPGAARFVQRISQQLNSSISAHQASGLKLLVAQQVIGACYWNSSRKKRYIKQQLIIYCLFKCRLQTEWMAPFLTWRLLRRLMMTGA